MEKSADVLLSDGSAAHMRQIRRADASAIVEFHARMSDRTRYLRYFSPYPRIPERDLERFVNVDHHDREAFVIVSGPRIMAVGRYERLGPDSPDAEVAFVVEDAHQGRGIGSVLLEHLAEAARENGITRFVAEVLPQNGGMLRVFGLIGGMFPLVGDQAFVDAALEMARSEGVDPTIRAALLGGSDTLVRQLRARGELN